MPKRWQTSLLLFQLVTPTRPRTTETHPVRLTVRKHYTTNSGEEFLVTRGISSRRNLLTSAAPARACRRDTAGASSKRESNKVHSRDGCVSVYTNFPLERRVFSLTVRRGTDRHTVAAAARLLLRLSSAGSDTHAHRRTPTPSSCVPSAEKSVGSVDVSPASTAWRPLVSLRQRGSLHASPMQCAPSVKEFLPSLSFFFSCFPFSDRSRPGGAGAVVVRAFPASLAPPTISVYFSAFRYDSCRVCFSPGVIGCTLECQSHCPNAWRNKRRRTSILSFLPLSIFRFFGPSIFTWGFDFRFLILLCAVLAGVVRLFGLFARQVASFGGSCVRSECLVSPYGEGSVHVRRKDAFPSIIGALFAPLAQPGEPSQPSLFLRLLPKRHLVANSFWDEQLLLLFYCEAPRVRRKLVLDEASELGICLWSLPGTSGPKEK